MSTIANNIPTSESTKNVFSNLDRATQDALKHELAKCSEREQREYMGKGLINGAQKIGEGFKKMASGFSYHSLTQLPNAAMDVASDFIEMLGNLAAMIAMFVKKKELENKANDKNLDNEHADSAKFTFAGESTDRGHSTNSSLVPVTPFNPENGHGKSLVSRTIPEHTTIDQSKIIDAEFTVVPGNTDTSASESYPYDVKFKENNNTKSDQVLPGSPYGDNAFLVEECQRGRDVFKNTSRVINDCESLLLAGSKAEGVTIELSKTIEGKDITRTQAFLNQLKNGINPLDPGTIAKNPVLEKLTAVASNVDGFEKLLMGNSALLKSNPSDPNILEARKIIIYAGLQSKASDVQYRAFCELKGTLQLNEVDTIASNTRVPDSQRIKDINDVICGAFKIPGNTALNFNASASTAVGNANRVPEAPTSMIG